MFLFNFHKWRCWQTVPTDPLGRTSHLRRWPNLILCQVESRNPIRRHDVKLHPGPSLWPPSAFTWVVIPESCWCKLSYPIESVYCWDSNRQQWNGSYQECGKMWWSSKYNVVTKNYFHILLFLNAVISVMKWVCEWVSGHTAGVAGTLTLSFSPSSPTHALIRLPSHTHPHMSKTKNEG